MRLVLLGPPGAGKGTQAHRLADRHGLSLIATGDILRQNVDSGTELGQKAAGYMAAGELVPDVLVVAMLMGALEAAPQGFVLDGFPRNLAQAETLDGELERRGIPLTAALAFLIDDEVAVKRVAGRRTCERCQRTYNVALLPPTDPDTCDACGGRLVQRTDDREETVRRRLDVYRESTEPLIGFYARRGVLREVDADGTEDEVAARMEAALSTAAGVEPAAADGER